MHQCVKHSVAADRQGLLQVPQLHVNLCTPCWVSYQFSTLTTQHRVRFSWSSQSRSPNMDGQSRVTSSSPSCPGTAFITGFGPLKAVAAELLLQRAFADRLARWARAGGTALSADACACIRTETHHSEYNSRMLVGGAGCRPGMDGAALLARLLCLPSDVLARDGASLESMPVPLLPDNTVACS